MVLARYPGPVFLQALKTGSQPAFSKQDVGFKVALRERWHLSQSIFEVCSAFSDQMSSGTRAESLILLQE